MAILRQRFVNSKGIVGTLIDILSDGDIDHTETPAGSVPTMTAGYKTVLTIT
jgi:hypothetical protein